MKAADFNAIEEDMLFMIHKMVVQEEVFDSLLVLTRLLNNIDDRKIRHKLKKLEKKMFDHATNLEFEEASNVRDEISRIKEFVFSSSNDSFIILPVILS